MFRKERKFNKISSPPLEKIIEGLSLDDTPYTPSSRSIVHSLPPAVLDAVFSHFDSREALALSATCKQFQPYATWAYKELRFVLGQPERPETLVATLETIRSLLLVLQSRADYATSVRSITLCDPIPPVVTPFDEKAVVWEAWDLLVENLDELIAQVITQTPMLRHFAWSDYSVRFYMNGTRSIAQLKKLQHLQSLSTFRVYGQSADYDITSQDCAPPLERFVVDCLHSAPYWYLPFLRGNNRLRSLDLRFPGHPEDRKWLQELCMAGLSWSNLRTLNITCTEDEAPWMIHLMRHCAVGFMWRIVFERSLTIVVT